LEQALQRLRDYPDRDQGRTDHLSRAAQAVWHFFIQRELCGLVNHDQPIADFRIPAEVLALVGAGR
jgi:hypothetical protein